MTLPSSNLSLDDIYQESTPGYGSATEPFSDIAYDSWAQGALGSGTNTYNGYGLAGGAPTGKDIIYGFTPTAQGSTIYFSSFLSKQYYFDGTTFDIKYSYNNTLFNIPFPPPGINNDVTIEVRCYDYGNTYYAHNSFNINMNAATNQTPTQMPGFSPSSFPLVANVYWEILVNVSPFNSISNIAFSINGTNVLNTGGGISSGGVVYTWQTSTNPGTTNGSGIVYDFVIS